MKYTLYLLFVLVFFSSCSSIDNDVLKTLPVYSIPLKNSDIEKNDLKLFTDLFDSMEVIPLNFKDSTSLIVSVDKVILFDSSYFVLDKKFYALCRFNNKGLCIGRYGKIGLGPGEFKRIDDFAIDSVGNSIVIVSNDDKSLYYYSLKDGSFIKRVYLDIFASGVSVLPDQNILLHVNYNVSDKSGSYNLLLVDPAGRVKKRYFPVQNPSSTAIIPFSGFLSASNNRIYFADAFSEIVYVYDSAKFKPYTAVNINSSYVSENKANHKKIYRKDIMVDPATSYLGSLFLDNKDYTILTFTNKKARKTTIYNKRTNTLKLLGKGIEDPEAQILEPPHYLGADNTIVFSVSPERILYLKDHRPDVLARLPDPQREIFEQTNENSNYYLFVARLKSSL